MRAVWSWLLELVELDRAVTAEEGAALLTAAGLEVEGVEHIGADVSGVVIAEVVARRKHPDADKLTLVDVIDADGGPVTEVVCGAPNVPEPGGRVLWARPGAVLPGDFRIAPRKIKGVMSAGMLCAEDELGLGDDHGGILVLQGEDARRPLGGDALATLGLRDTIFEISVPANRPDALGHLGLARELVALVGGRVRPLADAPVPAELVDEGLSAAELCSVRVDDPDGCPRYTARIIDGVTVRPSPLWMQQRLRAVGVRPLSNLVDVTNYVLFELGQPLHAFDRSKLDDGAIVVRRARAGERMTTLDEVERALEPGDLLICRGATPVALAGVMGGLETEVADDTRRVLLESASFAPLSIRKTAKRLGLHSESSHRFERGVDPNLAALASSRAAALIARLGGGKVAQGIVDAYPREATPRRVSMRPSRASQLVGIDFTGDQAADTLGRLGLAVTPAGEDRLEVECPTYRTDLTREVDLIEELIRIHGYDKVPDTLPRSDIAPATGPTSAGDRARAALVGIGMSEAITFGFTSPQRIAALRLPEGDVRARPIPLQNPMSVEQAVMRTSLYPNLLAAVARNRKFDVPDVALFEVGSVFLRNSDDEPLVSLPDEPTHVVGVLAGDRPGWLGHGAAVDFFDAKGAVEHVLTALGLSAAFAATRDIPYLHPGLCAEIRVGDRVIGEVGEIHPDTRAAFELDLPVFGFRIDLSGIRPAGPAQMQPIPRYPAISRDISFFVAEQVPAARVATLIAEADEPLIEGFGVREEYKDPDKVPAGQKGMLWSITYRSAERTLTDAEVDRAHEALVGRLLTTLDAQRR